MSILSAFNNAASNAVAATSSTRRMPFGAQTNPTDRPKAKVWLNPGYYVTVNKGTDQEEAKFISLPLGMPIDTMEAADVRGQNVDFVKQRTAQNQLLKMIQELGASMAPGEERELNLVIQLRRVNEALTVADADNEYAIDPTSLFAAKPANIIAAE